MERSAVPPKDPPRAGALPALGALALTIAAIAISIGFLTWRGSEQRRVLEVRQARCKGGDAPACDSLRSACTKRSGEACLSLSDVYFAEGPLHDPKEGLRLLGEACVYHHAAACLGAGRAYLEGTRVPKDLGQARSFLDRGCDYGAHEACALRQTVP